jgi:ADP-ribose pyrophosphatase YjhB (NUDIX family)
MKNTTLLFLIQRSEGKVTNICLAMKKRGFGQGRWNGVGGKVAEGESVEDAVRRETQEEIGVMPRDISKVAELAFSFALKPEWNQLTHVYFSESWEGEPTESEEMKPAWYRVNTIPFERMWPDDPFWLPRVIQGELLKARFTFGEGDSVLDMHVEAVPKLEE